MVNPRAVVTANGAQALGHYVMRLSRSISWSVEAVNYNLTANTPSASMLEKHFLTKRVFILGQ